MPSRRSARGHARSSSSTEAADLRPTQPELCPAIPPLEENTPGIDACLINKEVSTLPSVIVSSESSATMGKAIIGLGWFPPERFSSVVKQMIGSGSNPASGSMHA
ncbi:hypothetical protein L1987_45511 [Smallanthus sonchifolius]|uniref:Uncharacterized protein n=1 Tax=Smallanthus sonchifolius TaxID=185202 RepID=A0ACB9FY78_9ASTR|nr:hypothetical protein L1987_45511 [Smallanthus sonchifolius]